MVKSLLISITFLLLCRFVDAQADLKISSPVTINAPNPVHVGITINVKFSVQNIGLSPAAASHTGIYLSPTTSISGGKLLSEISLESLPAGASSNDIQFNFPIPYWVTNDGPYYVIVKLNDDGAVNEDLSNNQAQTQITVAKAPWAAQNLPYPIIFIHGLASDDRTWANLIDSLQNFYGWSNGGNMNFCLNYDASTSTSDKTTDYHDFTDVSSLHADDFYTVNFNVNFDGIAYSNSTINESNESGVVKQGLAIRDAIKHVLAVTGKDKVILVGHSMGGLAAREYLQNPSIWKDSLINHHVAKLLTVGTPHGGSNFTDWGNLLSFVVDVQSEAVRDLRTYYTYSSLPGAYLFDGAEDDAYMNDLLLYNFHNVDVNCNGKIGEAITGINNKAIPTDLTYSCIAGIGDPLSDNNYGDGVVSMQSANINNFLPVNAPVFILPKIGTLNIWHTELTKQFWGILRGLDEPSNDNNGTHAYAVNPDQLYYGNITYQSDNTASKDYDYYKITVPSNGTLNIQVYNMPLAQYSFDLFNSSNTNIYSQSSNGKSYITANITVTSGTYYMVISGNPIEKSYQFPYSFKYSFTKSTTYCSGTSNLTDTSATFSDGSGNNNYSNNSDCRWLIQPSGATSISLGFSAFNVSAPGDTLYIYNGGTTSSPLLGKFTGSAIPSKVTSSVGTMLVRFSTDGVTTAAGWTAKYTSVRVPVYCSGTTKLTNATGTFSDGSATNDYGNNSRCSWLIAPSGAYSVTLNFLTFITETSNDIVNVYDGTDNTATKLGSFSGSTIPSAITSSGGSMFIEFITNASVTAAGWSASYTAYIPYSSTGITKYETWFDDNFIARNLLSIILQDTLQLKTNITTNTLSKGLHVVHMRFMDNNNKWSSPISQYFIKVPPTSGNNSITGYEYWFDGNYAGKKSQTISWQEGYQLLTGLSANGLTSGLHSFHIRFKDAGGVWSSVVDQYIVYIPSGMDGKITGYEYWFDNNYIGKVTNNVDSLEILNLNTKLPTSALSNGVHLFSIRFKDNNEKWSEVTSQFITKTPAFGTKNKITSYEYWFDNNYTKRKKTTITGQQNYQLTANLTASGLKQGLHSFHIRFKDAGGAWSSTVNQFFIYTPGTGVSQINRYEYWFDSKYSKKVVQDVVPSVEIYTLNTAVSASTLTTGNHKFNIRFRQTNGFWSSVITAGFKKAAAAVLTEISIKTDTLKFNDNNLLFVYPNPSTGFFTVGIDEEIKARELRVYDGVGNIVYKKPLNAKTVTVEVDLGLKAQGTYFVEVNDGSKKYTRKVVIAR